MIQPIWLSTIESKCLIQQIPKSRPQTSADTQKNSRNDSNEIISSRPTTKQGKRIHLESLDSSKNTSKEEKDQFKKNKEKENEECWKAWKAAKDKSIRSEKIRQIEEEKSENDSKEQGKDPEMAKASFLEWKRSKWRQQLEEERKEQEMMQEIRKRAEEAHLQRMEELKVKRQEQLILLKNSSKSIKTKKIKPISSFLQEAERSLPRGHIDMISLRKKAMSEHKRNEVSDKKHHVGRFQHRNSSRAHTLQQLREWNQPSDEIYYISSILHKIVLLETPNDTVLIDPWRWLPWSITRTVFQDELIQQLSQVQITKLNPETITLLYIHCYKQNYKLNKIKKISEVGSALGGWVNNLAGIQELIHGFPQQMAPIDQLYQSGVPYNYIARAFLMTEVYPYVKVKHEMIRKAIFEPVASPILNKLIKRNSTLKTEKQTQQLQKNKQSLNPFSNNIIVSYRVHAIKEIQEMQQPEKKLASSVAAFNDIHRQTIRGQNNL